MRVVFSWKNAPCSCCSEIGLREVWDWMAGREVNADGFLVGWFCTTVECNVTGQVVRGMGQCYQSCHCRSHPEPDQTGRKTQGTGRLSHHTHRELLLSPLQTCQLVWDCERAVWCLTSFRDGKMWDTFNISLFLFLTILVSLWTMRSLCHSWCCQQL